MEQATGEQVKCRSYQLLIRDNDDMRPSTNYKNVILKGAREHGLPDDYIFKLEAIEDNGYDQHFNINHPDEPLHQSGTQTS